MRDHYLNGDPIDLKHNGCDGCAVTSVNGQITHERGCPYAYKDVVEDDDGEENHPGGLGYFPYDEQDLHLNS